MIKTHGKRPTILLTSISTQTQDNRSAWNMVCAEEAWGTVASGVIQRIDDAIEYRRTNNIDSIY